MAGAWLLTISAAVLHVVAQRARTTSTARRPPPGPSRAAASRCPHDPRLPRRLLAHSRYAQARDGDVVARGSAIVLGALGGVLCAAALIVGFIVLTKK